MRYYYTDPLKAAWMLREFNIQFEDDNPKLGTGAFEGKFMTYGNKFYIHPDCHDMFKPQEDDIVIALDSVGTFDEDEGVLLNGYNYGECMPLNEVGFIEIIQRNNKAFFTPEIEE